MMHGKTWCAGKHDARRNMMRGETRGKPINDAAENDAAKNGTL
jgi:hypothetical protein